MAEFGFFRPENKKIPRFLILILNSIFGNPKKNFGNFLPKFSNI
jgi:hypothetical protein